MYDNEIAKWRNYTENGRIIFNNPGAGLDNTPGALCGNNRLFSESALGILCIPNELNIAKQT